MKSDLASSSKIICIFFLCIVLWLLFDFIMVKMQLHWREQMADPWLWCIQYFIFLYCLKNKFNHRPQIQAWLLRLFIAFLLLLIFLLVLMPILLSFHVWVGGRL